MDDSRRRPGGQADTATAAGQKPTTTDWHARTLADSLGKRPLQAHCHLALGTLYAKTGRPDPARAELSTAIALYCAMDMTF